jgi:hypothetical protein
VENIDNRERTLIQKRRIQVEKKKRGSEIVGRKIKDRNQQRQQHTIPVEGGRTNPWTRFPTFQKPQG